MVPTESFIAWITAWIILDLILSKTLPVPDKIKLIKDDKERETAFWEYLTNMLSIVHAVSTFVVSVILLQINGLNYISKNTEGQTNLLVFSVSYFVSDAIFGYWKGYNDKLMHFHHFLAIFSFGYMAFKGMYASNACWCYVITECTNPLLLLSKNLDRHSGYEKLSKAFSIVFAITFIICRTYLVKFCLVPMLQTPVVLFLKLQGALTCYLNRALINALELDYSK